MILYKKEDGSLTDIHGKPVRDAATLAYVKSLVIPPAYRNVRIFMEEDPKIVFEGTDSKGRLQQIYSKKWRAAADKNKFKKLIKFGRQLPQIFAHIEKHMREKRSTKNKCIAIILKIISQCYFRVGNQKYEKLYQSHGISTIKKHHIYDHPKSVEIRFIGKKGVLNECMILDPDLVSVLKEYVAKKKPTEDIFTYTEGGQTERIKHTDINDYLKKYDDAFTSKMFRTFDANTLLIDYLRNRGKAVVLSASQRKKNIVEAMKEISKCVNNTPAICKKSYVNQELIDLYIDDPVKFDRLIPLGKATARELFVRFLGAL